MRIITLFSILSLASIPMAFDLGDSSYRLWVNLKGENGDARMGVVYFFAFVVGAIALAVRLKEM